MKIHKKMHDYWVKFFHATNKLRHKINTLNFVSKLISSMKEIYSSSLALTSTETDYAMH